MWFLDPNLFQSSRAALTTATSSALSVFSASAFPPIVTSATPYVSIASSTSSIPPDAAAHSAELNSADLVMVLLTISVVLHVLNFHFLKIPSSVAMAFGAILLSVGLLILSCFPFLGVSAVVDSFRALLKDFPDLLLNYMLGFLLFAAAIEVDLRNLGRILSTVLALSVVSTFLSTFIVGTLTYFLMENIAHMDFAWCLLFGAVVSPTDPVTVISILNDKKDLLPDSTRYFVVGESLLNDAVGVVLYLVLIEIVQKPDIGGIEIATLIFETVFVECVYGAAIGVFLAWLAYSAIKSVHDPLLEVVITFVLVGNINMICRIFHASIPLASVFAGLFIGNYAVNFAMDENNGAVETFHRMWSLADETLNSILFLMIGGADLFWNPQDLGWGRVITLVVCTIAISMVARFLAVALPLLTIILLEFLTKRRLRHVSVRYRGGTIAVLTWAGMRGGISIALALGVPDSFVKHAVPGHMTYGQLIFFMTFILVVFSILVQGMLFEPVVKMINRVSFDLFASGGLGTYVSSTSLGNNIADFIDYDDGTPDGSIMSGVDHLWESTTPLYQDYDAEAPMPQDPLTSSLAENSSYGATAPAHADSHLRRSQSTKLHGDFARHASDVGVRSGATDPNFPQTAVGHAQSDNERRQGSITFQNLQPLAAPPSINQFLGDLRRRGTYSFQRWFSKDGDHPLRRSRTEPNNARLARGGQPSSVNMRSPPGDVVDSPPLKSED